MSRAILLHSPKLRNLYPHPWQYCLVAQDAVLTCRLLHPIPGGFWVFLPQGKFAACGAQLWRQVC